ncbi:MAG: carbohydrate-binding family 9-like protein [Cyclobacteriaceae bacterium]|nr:carbohydrate-binding family 9-like protein [Cyclobacteriaceae bacterium]MDH5251095.1 carbohydrate-binding family 9-like protein [Cyclobacteriaceae bacterium]
MSGNILHTVVFLAALSGLVKPASALAQTISQDAHSTIPFKNQDVMKTLLVRTCNDFELTGKGDNPAWNRTTWNQLTKLDIGGEAYQSNFKILYSATGIYLLFYGEDRKITTKAYEDFENIFNGDVFEVFFHPNPGVPVYFEYEINQLDKELILTISKLDGNTTSWIPWHPQQKNGRIKKLVDIIGGDKQVNGLIQSWSAEIFFPYAALGLLPRVPPASGSLWNANFCRLDYDSGKMIKWSWSPTIKTSFHELEEFHSIRFE